MATLLLPLPKLPHSSAPSFFDNFIQNQKMNKSKEKYTHKNIPSFLQPLSPFFIHPRESFNISKDFVLFCISIVTRASKLVYWPRLYWIATVELHCESCHISVSLSHLFVFFFLYNKVVERRDTSNITKQDRAPITY